MAFLAPPGVPGCPRDLGKNCKNSQKIYKKLTCIKIPQIMALRPILGYLDYPGGPQGGQKVIWWCKNFFLAESIWSFRQNTLYLSQVSGLGGHEPWFWLCPFTTPPYSISKSTSTLCILLTWCSTQNKNNNLWQVPSSYQWEAVWHTCRKPAQIHSNLINMNTGA